MASATSFDIEKESNMPTITAQKSHTGVLTHSLLLSNLHCPSCVSNIKELLLRLDPTPISISPSLVTSWVTVQHEKYLSVGNIRDALEDAGFDVCDIIPPEHITKGSPVYGNDRDLGYLDRFIDVFGSGKKDGSVSKSDLSKKHLQNCESCRLEADGKHVTSSQPKSPTPLATAEGLAEAMGEHPKSDLDVVVDSEDDQDIWQASFAVGGMTCAVCVNTINEELRKKAWIKKVTVNLISNSATIHFVGKQHHSEIVETIEDVGYDAAPDSLINLKSLQNTASPARGTARSVEILVNGMFCDHCPPRILTSFQPFGDSIKVEQPLSMTDPILRISYTPQVPDFTIRNIMTAISNASANEDESFKASIYHPPTLEERSRLIHQRERWRIFIRVLVALGIAVPTLIIGIIYMSLVPASNGGRRFLMKPLRAGVSRSQWALFVMATPVYFFCADVFHIRALKELRTMWRPGSTTPMFQRFYRFGSMNMLMSLGTSIAYISSVAQLIAAGVNPPLVPDNNTFYFDSVVFLTLFLLIGRLIEAYSKSKTGDAVLMLGKLRPTEALLIEANSSLQVLTGEEIVKENRVESTKSVNVDLLEYGDIVKVLHGASPPCDGIIIQGETKFDESSLTGESKLIKKSVGDEVFSGTVNKDTPISVKITGVAGSSMLDQIVKAVREGQTRRAPMERIADTLTGYFVPFVTLIAVGTWIIWLALGSSGTLPQDYLDSESGGWIAWSLQFAIAVFVVACPCGLALAAPTALFVGGGLAAQHGILVKGGGEAFEKASRLDCIVFDKTGTLTLGERPAVTNHETIPFDVTFQKENAEDSAAVVDGMIRTIEESSSHPIAQAIRAHCNDTSVEDVQYESPNVEEIPGKGMRGSFRVYDVPGVEEVDMIIGNEVLMAEHEVSISTTVQSTLDRWKSEGKSVALVAIRANLSSDSVPSSPLDSPGSEASWQLAVIFAIADPIRAESSKVVEQLKSRGLQVWMLSGDNQATANAVGAQVGIPEANIIAGVLPNQKAEKIQYLQRSLKSRRGFKSGTEHSQRRALVAMVGDGINDSPALTTADLGIAIGSGSDIAISSAEFVLVSSNLNSLSTLLDLSVTVFRRIKFNFAWALIYNLIALPVAAGVLYPIVSRGSHVRLDPVWASLAMAASSISVVCSSLALRSKIPWIGFKGKE